MSFRPPPIKRARSHTDSPTEPATKSAKRAPDVSAGTKPPNDNDDDDDDDDDYMSMTFAEPVPNPRRETLTERKRRLDREQEIKSRPKSKAQLDEEQRERLTTSLITEEAERTNKGLRMMKMMGYTPGSALGAEAGTTKDSKAAEDGKKQEEKLRIPDEEERVLRARLEPIGIAVKKGRGGIGHEDETWRAAQANAKHDAAKAQQRDVDPAAYRERVALEKEEKRCEGLFYAAQKVCEKFDSLVDFGLEEDEIGRERNVPLKAIPVVWRGAVRHREERARDARMKFDMLQSVERPRLPGASMKDMDDDDKVAFGLELPKIRGAEKDMFEVEVEGDDEDSEQDGFDQQSFAERLHIAVAYLRQKHWYCFWCKYKYDNAEMEDCPGEDEECHG